MKLDDALEARIEAIILDPAGAGPPGGRRARASRMRRSSRATSPPSRGSSRTDRFRGLRLLLDCANGCRLGDRSAGLSGPGRHGRDSRRRAERAQHQPRLRLPAPRRVERTACRGRIRRGPRVRRRRRPLPRGRPARPRRRRGSHPVPVRAPPEAPRRPDRRRDRRDDHEQLLAREAPRERGDPAPPSARRRQVRARADDRGKRRVGRRAVGPRDLPRPQHDGRRHPHRLAAPRCGARRPDEPRGDPGRHRPVPAGADQRQGRRRSPTCALIPRSAPPSSPPRARSRARPRRAALLGHREPRARHGRSRRRLPRAHDRRERRERHPPAPGTMGQHRFQEGTLPFSASGSGVAKEGQSPPTNGAVP